MTTAYLTGSGAYLCRAILKDKGWRWDADRKAWYKTAEWEDEADVIATVRSYGGIRNRGTFAATIEMIPE